MQNQEIYDQLSRLIFSGDFESGSNLVERDLASRLGVSRVPVRETLTQMVAQGVLEGGKRKREGVRIRRYSADEIRQLYDYRAIVEGGISRGAAGHASQADILRLTMICDEMETLLEVDDSSRWGALDGKFHEALAEASRNDRFERTLKSLLRECFYVFYILSRRSSRREMTPEALISHKKQTLKDHRAITSFVKSGDADAAEKQARLHILRSADRVIRMYIESDVGA
ncbi:MAG TPA: GntR family transcriptional regulator [Planctomicrobium sp.]|nr:GntR family transcriptional regulator [Planctomicrobium sp.]